MHQEQAQELATAEEGPLTIDEVLTFTLEQYKDTELIVLNIKDFPLKPNYFILNDYLIISSSLDCSQQMIRTQKDNLDSLATYLESERMKDKFFEANYFIALFDFQTLLEDFTNSLFGKE